MAEEWRWYSYFDGYQVSSMGRVRSWNPRSGRWQKLASPRLIRPVRGVGGYLRVTLRADGRPHRFLVHRLVLMAFVGQPPTPQHHACHLDNDPSNNSLANLEWRTADANLAQRWTADGNGARGSRVGTSKITEEQALAIAQAYRRKSHRRSNVATVAEQFNVHPSTVLDIATGRRWAHLRVLP